MKKLLFLFALTIVFLSAGITLNAQEIEVAKGETYKVYTGVAGDTLQSTTNVLSTVIYFTNKDFLDQWYKYDIYADLDSLGDATSADISLQGSYNNSSWTNIETVTWSMSTPDTTIRYNNLASDVVQTVADFAVTTDTTGLINHPADSLIYPATTRTTTYNVVAWPYLRIYGLGSAAGTKAELEAVRAKFIKPFKSQ